MSLKSPRNFNRFAVISLAAVALIAAGCGSSSLVSTTQSASAPTGSAFVVGTDAPLASVVSFATTISVTATPVGATAGGSSDVTLVSSQSVDFARYNGLQTLLDQNQVKAQSYQSITITLGTGTIGYLNVPVAPATGAPTISTITPVTYSPSNSVTITLPTPFVVPTTGAPSGLRIDFDLGKSIGVSSGAITGTVTPTFDVSTVKNTDATAHIDEQIGSIVKLPTSTTEPSSFVIQGPHGENFTVNTTSSTEWDGGASLGSLNANSVVAVAGQLDAADQTLDADEVALITDSHFYARGLITYVAPSSGQATNTDFYVRAVEPSSDADVPLGGIAQVDITGKENYGIYWMHNAFTELLFNSYALTPGQEIAVGGTDAEATPATGTAITVNRIHLQNWGYNGTIVPKSQSASAGSFTMQITGFAGQVVASNVTVFLGPQCDFRYGFGAFNDLTDSTKVRVVGLLLKNPTNGQLVLLARHVDGVDFTDFATFAF
ncbi:MAG: DUF4382 domain-containing protein [Terracidiphilus sp.]